MKVLQPQAFGEKSTNVAIIINRFTKVELPCTPFLKAFAICKICDRTAVPYSKYVPENQEKISGSGMSYKHFQIRFDIMVYALACYPSGFSRQAIMQKNKSTVRTQQRILQSLVHDGFLSKNQPYVSAGAYFKAIPSKLYNISYAIDSQANPKDIDASEFLPKHDLAPAECLSDTNKSHQQNTFKFDVYLDILTYAAACGSDGFSRKDVMQNMQFLKERTQQRLLEGLVKGGFLSKKRARYKNMYIYRFEPSKMKLLLRFLSTINL